jgi:hypothetical protein
VLEYAEKEAIVKHITSVSKMQPAKANEFQYVVCKVAQVIYDVLGAGGGNVPFLSYIVEKCDLPTET